MQLETRRPKKGFSNFLDFLGNTLCDSLDTKVQQKETSSINGERLVAVEHVMFKFEGLKVNSRDDRQTDKMKSTKCGPSPHYKMVLLPAL